MERQDEEVSMVMAPEKPPRVPRVTGAWRWLAVGLIVLLVVAGAVLAIVVLTDDPPTADGVGPVGPVGPQDDVGPQDTDAIVGNGTITSESRDVAAFDTVVLAGEGNAGVVIGGEHAVSVRTDENLVSLITTEVRDSTLFLDTDPTVTDIDPTESVTYEITVPALVGLEITGAGTITADGIVADRLDLALLGAGTIRVSGLEASRLFVDARAAGSVELTGRVTTQDVELGGTVAYRAGELESTRADIESESSSTATVWVTDDLSVVLTGVGDLAYYGSPSVDAATGIAEVRPLGEK